MTIIGKLKALRLEYRSGFLRKGEYVGRASDELVMALDDEASGGSSEGWVEDIAAGMPLWYPGDEPTKSE